jgi:type VI secretion system protein ImpF
VLDRLWDDGTEDRTRPSRAVHAALRRDLEALLNARRPWASVPDRLAVLRRGIFGYGLPDFATGAFNAPAQREALCREIELAIQRFEPRLRNASVKLLDRIDHMDPVLRVRIEGVLMNQAEEEAVGFETLLDATTTDLIVRPAARV